MKKMSSIARGVAVVVLGTGLVIGASGAAQARDTGWTKSNVSYGTLDTGWTKK
ncbi:hypothetical protein GCM10027425_26640 [Alteromonas gracilis]